MNQPSSTISAAVVGGTIAGLLIGATAIWFPEQYENIRLYPGFEAHLATAIGGIIGYFKKENVLPVRKN